jgi:outer membrane biosynthesis protein TonB
MRHNPNNRRSRGRSGRKGPNPLTRAFESNGPDVKVRGTAAHIAEKYMMLARDAVSSGDNVAAENYFQHAEHYNRIIAAAQSQAQQAQQDFRPRDGEDDSYEGERHMNGRSMDFGRDERGYQSESDEDTDDAPAPPQRHARHQQPPEQQQGPQQQAPQQQPAEEPEQRPRRRRRPRSEDQSEAPPAPRSRDKTAAAGSNGAGEGDEDTTHDGQAALAAFPD